MKMNDTSLVVFSCDAYSDLWDDFFKFLNIYWTDIPYDCYLVNNRKGYENKNIKVINAGDVDWSSRTRIALEQIKTSYVITFLEDFFVSEVVNTEAIKEAILLMEKDKIDYYQLNIDSKKDYKDWTKYEENSFLYNIPKTRPYWVDTSISIWNKEFFLQLLGKEDYSAWKFELDRNEDARYPDRYKDKKCILDSRNLIAMCPMVIQGKFYPLSIKEMQRKGHVINSKNRKIMSSIEVVSYKMKRFFSWAPFGRKLLKSIGRKLGYTFMSDIYK